MRKHRIAAVFVLGWCAAWAPSQAPACGYHDDVTLARGMLNWTYPDALHVLGAMAQAVSERRLPPPARTPDLWAYHRTVRSLEQLGEQLRIPAGENAPMAFALLLIEPMLWTRFTPEGGDLHAQVHVPAPPVGELVLISGEDVVREIANHRLSVGDAYRHGLIRLYGTETEVSRFLQFYCRCA
ncbi:hypothetical protein [Bradyrhizobium brasilense]|uniref:hypothetical protein n=1 Tax=Bradyrhizobium brasilense TaxID=1419277 RepID=UPI0009764F53|nr:hypothetical protein [Bradyrhizobium brasilense]